MRAYAVDHCFVFDLQKNLAFAWHKIVQSFVLSIVSFLHFVISFLIINKFILRRVHVLILVQCTIHLTALNSPRTVLLENIDLLSWNQAPIFK